MGTWITRILILVIALAVGVLTATSLPTLMDHHMAGRGLMLHMMAGGALVFVMPLFALFFLAQAISPARSGGLQRLGFWLLVATTLTAIASVFLCMLPLPSTEQMHELMMVHGYAGFATVPALVLLVLGALRWRRIQATRSATPG